MLARPSVRKISWTGELVKSWTTLWVRMRGGGGAVLFFKKGQPPKKKDSPPFCQFLLKTLMNLKKPCFFGSAKKTQTCPNISVLLMISQSPKKKGKHLKKGQHPPSFYIGNTKEFLKF